MKRSTLFQLCGMRRRSARVVCVMTFVLGFTFHSNGIAAREIDAVLTPAKISESAQRSRSTNAASLPRNPFKRPPILEVAPLDIPAVVAVPPPWSPQLRATVVARVGRSLVNVDGQMIEKGMEYQGFMLVEVKEREAVFERGGHRWVLTLD